MASISIKETFSEETLNEIRELVQQISDIRGMHSMAVIVMDDAGKCYKHTTGEPYALIGMLRSMFNEMEARVLRCDLGMPLPQDQETEVGEERTG